MSSCAVVGAGASGLSAARLLCSQGMAVSVFDKGRRSGGRIARRQTTQGVFEHGAPWSAVTLPWLADVLATEHMAGVTLHTSQHVETIERTSSGWMLRFAEAQPAECFDAVIVTVPAPQLSSLLSQCELPVGLRHIRYSPCWTLLWTPDSAVLTTVPDHRNERLRKVIREDIKPGDAGPVRITVHAAADWSRQMLECDAESVRATLLTDAADSFGVGKAGGFCTVHRWRYAHVEQALGSAQLTLAPGLHYASDGCIGDGIAGAVQSGHAAAQALLRQTHVAP